MTQKPRNTHSVLRTVSAAVNGVTVVLGTFFASKCNPKNVRGLNDSLQSCKDPDLIVFVDADDPNLGCINTGCPKGQN